MLHLKAAISGAADAPQLLARLLQNQRDIGDALASQDITNALTHHIQLAGAAVAAAIKGADAGEASAFVNQAAEIAQAFSPLIPYEAGLEGFTLHNRQVLGLASLILQKNWAQETIAYDTYVAHMAHIAQTLCDAL
jgi:hypothetical protein